MERIITKEMLECLKDGEKISGVILIKNYSTRLTKNSKEYIDGILESKIQIPFKIWNNAEAFDNFKIDNFINQPMMIHGVCNNYQGQMSIIIDHAEKNTEYNVFNFLESKYNQEMYSKMLIGLCKKNMTEQGFELADHILFAKPDLYKRFCTEFAGMHYHDNCLSGLLAHTYKLLQILSLMLFQHPEFITNPDGSENSDFKDLLFIGGLIHDIAKTDEMKYGVYQPNSAVTHRIIGLDYIFDSKDEIIAKYGEKWYRDLQSIMVEHHGSFEDPCKTLAAFLIHKADALESIITQASQAMQTPTEDSSGKKIKIETYTLTL